MAQKPTTTENLDSDVAKELEEALDFDLTGDGGDLDIAASMEDLEAQISQAADELARASANDKKAEAARRRREAARQCAAKWRPQNIAAQNSGSRTTDRRTTETRRPMNGARSPTLVLAAAGRPFAGQ